MNERRFSLKKSAVLMGSLIAFYIGAGFATGQEVMQYCAAYGRQAVSVVACFMVMFSYSLASCARAGAALQNGRGKDVFAYFCGTRLGTLYDLYTTVFLYLSLVIMHGGAASTAHMQYGLPAWAGALLLSLLAAGTVLLGLNRLVAVLGRIGPVLIAALIFTAAVTVWHNADHIAAGMELIASGQVVVPRIGTNFFTATLSNVGFVTLFYAPIMAELGAQNGLRELKCASLSAVAAIGAAMLLLSLALIGDICAFAGADIPTLLMARRISPLFGQFFSVVICLGIYTASVPLLWTVSTRFCAYGTVGHKATVAGLCAATVVIAVCLPYRTLVNWIYGFGGYLGAALLVFQLAHDVRRQFFQR